MKMPWGKYKGQDMEDVPAGYLLWLYESDTRTIPVKEYLEKNIEGIRKQVEDGDGEI